MNKLSITLIITVLTVYPIGLVAMALHTVGLF